MRTERPKTLQESFDELGDSFRQLGHEVWRQKGDLIRLVIAFWLGMLLVTLFSCAGYDRGARTPEPAYPKIEPIKPGST